MQSQPSNNFTLRPALAEDNAFLLELYTAGRTAELAAVGWIDQQIRSFCAMQYQAQNWQHDMTFAGAIDQIVQQGGESIGRLKVYETEKQLLLVDIALLPAYQNQGIGTALLELLKAKARTGNKPLRLHVLVTSLGVRLYERLGFTRIADDGSYIEMEFRAR